MLLVMSIPNEYGMQIRAEARENGLSVRQIIRNLIVSNFPRVFQKSSDVSNVSSSLDSVLALARNSKKTGTPEKWTRADFHDDREM